LGSETLACSQWPDLRSAHLLPALEGRANLVAADGINYGGVCLSGTDGISPSKLMRAGHHDTHRNWGRGA